MESSHVVYSQEMHWRLAAKWNGIEYSKFVKLEGEEQSRLVATYETAMQMEAVMTADAQRQARRKQPRRSHGN